MLINNILNIIASSSAGNCYIYNKDLMIDIGVSYKKVKPYLKDIKLILLTHAHTDHFNKIAIKQVCYNYPNIKFVCGEWLVDRLIQCGVNKKNIYLVKINRKYDLGKYIIEPVLAIHDVNNCGYKIIIKSNDYKIFHISDTSEVKHIEAKNFDLYSIEANYLDDDDLNNKIQQDYNNGKDFSHYERVRYTHLSQEDALKWLKENIGDNSRVQFIHQHIADKEVVRDE